MKTVNNLKKLSFASGAALALSVASSTVIAADSNPFGMSKLNGGYQVAMSGDKVEHAEGKCGENKAMEAEGKCGEGKCGENKAKEAEGKCGEGKCGENKAKDAEGKCGEGKCGEGKCGGSKTAE